MSGGVPARSDVSTSRSGTTSEGSAPLETALDGSSRAIDDTDVAEDLAGLLGLGVECVKLGVVLRELGDELVARCDRGERGRDEGLGRKGSKAFRKGWERWEGGGGGGEKAGEDGELARDVRPGQVVCWMGLLPNYKTVFMSLCDNT